MSWFNDFWNWMTRSTTPDPILIDPPPVEDPPIMSNGLQVMVIR